VQESEEIFEKLEKKIQKICRKALKCRIGKMMKISFGIMENKRTRSAIAVEMKFLGELKTLEVSQSTRVRSLR
jgi:hypothetical protein